MKNCLLEMSVTKKEMALDNIKAFVRKFWNKQSLLWSKNSPSLLVQKLFSNEQKVFLILSHLLWDLAQKNFLACVPR